MPGEKRINELFERWRLGLSSGQEDQELLSLLEEFQGLEDLSPELQHIWDQVAEGEVIFKNKEEGIKLILDNFPAGEDTYPGEDTHPDISRSGAKTRVLSTHWFRYAAAVLIIVVSAGVLLWLTKGSKEDMNAARPSMAAAGIVPGGNKAILKLDDGSSVLIDDQPVGLLKYEDGVRIDKVKDGLLRYEQEDIPGLPVKYHTLVTPVGGQYQMVLPDGTSVWLNAASSIRYPTAFRGKRREVWISGELYFDVVPARPFSKEASAGNPQPFIVHVGKQTINVLGTSFNVMAYDDEEIIKTTLVEGRVRVEADPSYKGNGSWLLNPGQQLIQESGDINIRNVATQDVIAWKNGYFVFDNANVKEVLRQLIRWYDIETEVGPGLKGLKFSGEIPRSSSLDELLEILKAGGLNVSMKGRKLIITEKPINNNS